METIIGDGDPDEEADGEGNDSANPSTSKDELIEKISNLELLLAGREEIIEALKEDLNREKKLNDILIDQIVLLKSFNSKSLPSHPSDSSSDTSDDEEQSQLSLIPAAQEQRKPPSRNNSDDDDDDDKSVKSSSSTAGDPPKKVDPPKNDEDDDDVEKDSQPDAGKKTPKTLTDIHERDTGTSKKLSYILNTLKNLPENRSTLFIGDSNFHCIHGELDPVTKSTAVRAVSGLCVVAAADALKRYEHSYTKFKKIVWSLGVNDYLHRQDHCPDDWDDHLTALLCETKRVFMGAKVHFILPFRGIPKVPHVHIKYMEQTIKEIDPTVKKHLTPSLHGKVKADGIHINKEGADVLRRYLVTTFTNYRPSQQPHVNHQTGRAGNPPTGRVGNPPTRRVGNPPTNTNPYQRLQHQGMFGRNEGFGNDNGQMFVNRRPSIITHGPSSQQEPTMDEQFPPLQHGVSQYGPSERILRNHNNPVQELSDILASMLYTHLNRSMNS